MSNLTATDAIQGVRNANLTDLTEILRTQQALKIDVVAAAETLRVKDGNLVLSGLDQQISEDGVTDPNGIYRPTAAADSDIAEKLSIGGRYLRKLRETGRTDLYDANVNGLLRGKQRRVVDGSVETIHAADDRNFMLRLFRGDENGQGVLRAMLSDRFGRIDHLDLLMSVLSGIREAGVDLEIRECDLTDHFMRVRAYSPQVSALAPTLLGNYRNPFANPEMEAARKRISAWQGVAAREGQSEDGLPVVFAGFEFGNSETGHGAVSLQPRLLVRVCKNGLTLPAFAVKKAHLGARVDEGWGFEVQAKSLDVIKAQAKQKVAEWLSSDFLTARVTELEQAAGAVIASPAKTAKVLAKRFEWTEAEADSILSHFTLGGQGTAAGFANAITSFTQTIPSAERASTLDDQAVAAMELAAAQR